MLIAIRRRIALNRLQRQRPDVRKVVAAALRDDPDFVIRAARIDSQYVQLASDRLLGDKSFARVLLEHAPHAYKHMPESVRADMACALTAVRFTPGNLAFASNHLLAEKALVLAAIRAEHCMNSPTESSPSLELASPSLKSDEEILHAVQIQIRFKVKQGDYHTNR